MPGTLWTPTETMIFHPTIEELEEMLCHPDKVKNKKLRRTWEHRERVRWRLNDIHSGINRLVLMSGELTAPIAKFSNGQKVFQWWAKWFATAQEPLMQNFLL